MTVTLSGDEARLLRALDRVVAKEREVGEASKQVGEQSTQSFNRVENALGRAFGAGAIGTLGPYAVAIVGLKKTFEEIEGVLGRVNKAQEEAAKNAIAMGNAIGGLGKYAAGNKAVGDALSKAVSDTARETGMSPEQSAKLVEDLAAGGFRGNDEVARKRAIGLQRLGVEHAGQASMKLNSLQANSLGEAATLSAATRPGEVGELIEGTADTRELAASVGVSETELMASIAQAGKTAGSTKTGTSQAKAFLEALKKSGFKGSIKDAVRQLGGINTTDEHLSKAVGGKEGLEFLRSQQQETGAHLLGRLSMVSDDQALNAMGGNVDVGLATATGAAAGSLRDSQTEQGRLKANAERVRAEEYAADVKASGGVGIGTEVRRLNASLEPDFLVNRRKPIGSADDGQTAPTLGGSVINPTVEGLLREIAGNTKPKTQTLMGPGDK